MVLGAVPNTLSDARRLSDPLGESPCLTRRASHLVGELRLDAIVLPRDATLSGDIRWCMLVYVLRLKRRQNVRNFRGSQVQ